MTETSTRIVDERREAVALFESKLAGVKRQRTTILIDKRQAEARADKGDQAARREVATLGKQDVEVDRLELSIAGQLKQAKRWLACDRIREAGERRRGDAPEAQGV
jgi:hypothetical protein